MGKQRRLPVRYDYRLCVYLNGKWYSWYSARNFEEFLGDSAWQGLAPIAVISRPCTGLQKHYDLEYCRDTSPDLLFKLLGKRA